MDRNGRHLPKLYTGGRRLFATPAADGSVRPTFRHAVTPVYWSLLTTELRQFFEQRLCILQISVAEALGEPPVDRGE
jgi:hypothetical protein